MGLFKRKKKNQEANHLESDIAQKSINRMKEVRDNLISKGRYFSKPYSLKEVKDILARNQSITIYATVENKDVLFGKIDGENVMMKKTKFFLGSKFFSSLDELLADTEIFGYTLKDNWDKVNVIIMLDEQENQVL